MNKSSKIISIMVFSVIFVAFQNCAQVSDGMPEEASTVVAQKFSAVETQYVKILDYENTRFLELNLFDGEVLSVEQFGESQSDESYCLPSDELNKLKNIILDAKFCQSSETGSSPGDLGEKPEVCPQNYTFPYAILIKGAHEIRLGELRDGCDVPLDLCSGKGSQLRSFAADLVSNLKNYSCGVRR